MKCKVGDDEWLVRDPNTYDPVNIQTIKSTMKHTPGQLITGLPLRVPTTTKDMAHSFWKQRRAIAGRGLGEGGGRGFEINPDQRGALRNVQARGATSQEVALDPK